MIAEISAPLCQELRLLRRHANGSLACRVQQNARHGGRTSWSRRVARKRTLRRRIARCHGQHTRPSRAVAVVGALTADTLGRAETTCGDVPQTDTHEPNTAVTLTVGARVVVATVAHRSRVTNTGKWTTRVVGDRNGVLVLIDERETGLLGRTIGALRRRTELVTLWAALNELKAGAPLTAETAGGVCRIAGLADVRDIARKQLIAREVTA